jgi:hypothetical protein
LALSLSPFPAVKDSHILAFTNEFNLFLDFALNCSEISAILEIYSLFLKEISTLDTLGKSE